MNAKCSTLIDAYLKTLKDNFTVSETEDGCHIVTPFTKPDGEAIEIVVRKTKNGHNRVTDEFSTSDYLFLNGLHVESNRRLEDEVIRLARLHGVTFHKSELFIEVEENREADAIDKLLNAIEAITYLIYQRSHRAYRSFTDEVELFLAENEIRFEAEYSLIGKTIEHTVPIYLNSHRNTVLWPLSAIALNPIRHRVKEIAFVVQDVKAVEPTITFNAILDDRKEATRKLWDDEVVTRILSAHLDHTIVWENRQQLLRISR